MYIIMLYTLNYYEDKYFISLFAHFKHKARIYTLIIHILLKIGINNYTLVYIHINTHKYAYACIEIPKIFYYDTHKTIKKTFSCIYKN